MYVFTKSYCMLKWLDAAIHILWCIYLELIEYVNEILDKKITNWSKNSLEMSTQTQTSNLTIFNYFLTSPFRHVHFCVFGFHTTVLALIKYHNYRFTHCLHLCSWCHINIPLHSFKSAWKHLTGGRVKLGVLPSSHS